MKMEQYLDIKNRINAAAELSGRRGEDITLIGVTKTVSCDIINQAVALGITKLGENRVQELVDKYPHVHNAEWHLIGHLQTNKVKYIIDKVELIHSVDSFKLAEEIDKQAKKIKKRQNILIQVNIDGEESKFGIPFHQCEELVRKCSQLSNIKVCGLMAIPPKYDDIEQTRKTLRKCNNLFVDICAKKYHNIHMSIMSMGMSGDFEVAIEEGATMVRLGSIIFGKR